MIGNPIDQFGVSCYWNPINGIFLYLKGKKRWLLQHIWSQMSTSLLSISITNGEFRNWRYIPWSHNTPYSRSYCTYIPMLLFPLHGTKNVIRFATWKNLIKDKVISWSMSKKIGLLYFIMLLQKRYLFYFEHLRSKDKLDQITLRQFFYHLSLYNLEAFR